MNVQGECWTIKTYLSGRLAPVFAVLLALCLIFASCAVAESWKCPACGTENTGIVCSSCGQARSGGNLQLDVEFVQNELFATYGVNVYIDSEKVFSLEHGEDYSGCLVVDKGYHRLRFLKNDDKTVLGDVFFNVNGTTAFSCRITCYSDEVVIDNVLLNGEAPDPRIKPGESGTVKDVTVKFKSFEEADSYAGSAPASGNVFVICDFYMFNYLSEDLTFSPELCFEATCGEQAAAFAATGDTALEVTIASRQKLADHIVVFEVPADWQELEITFTPGAWCSNKLTFLAAK